jgi:hypothetical protein
MAAAMAERLVDPRRAWSITTCASR